MSAPHVVFVLDGGRFALPLSSAERVTPSVAFRPLPGAPAVALGAVNLRGSAVALIDVRRRLGLQPRPIGLDTRFLIVATRRRRLALAVDDVLGVEELDAGSTVAPERVLPGTHHVSGILPIADGLLLVQDLDALLSLEEEARLEAALETDAGRP